MTDTAWYCRDWSSGELIAVGDSVPFSPSTTFYCAPTAHAEGIKGHHKAYTGPCKSFLICVNGWEELARICLGVAEAMK